MIIDGDFFGGTLTTRPVRFSGKHFFVNLDAPSGGVWIEVFDEDGRLLLTSDRIKGDKTLLPVTWKGADDLSAVAGMPVRFRFHLYDGKLYSFWVSTDKSGASHGYVAAGGPGFVGTTDTVGMEH